MVHPAARVTAGPAEKVMWVWTFHPMALFSS